MNDCHAFGHEWEDGVCAGCGAPRPAAVPGSGQVLVLKPDVTVEAIDWPATGEVDNLRALYDALGCDTVELVRLTGELDMWIDEEGKLGGDTQVNMLASMLAYTHRAIHPRDVIVGRAVLTRPDGPNTVSLTADQLAELLAMLS